MDLDRERTYINRRGYDWYQENLGEVVAWFEYDAADSEYHPVYDEPSLTHVRKWRQAILVPVLWVNEEEDARRNERDGRLVTPSIRLGVPVRTLSDAGLSSPVESRRHLNDLLLYRGHYWAINDYQLRGRMKAHLIVGVTATVVDVENDMPFDDLPTLDGKAMANAPKGFPSDRYDTQSFPDHELPAYQLPPGSATAAPAHIGLGIRPHG